MDGSIAKMNKTCRNSGAVGANAIVPRYILTEANKTVRILDIGAGSGLIHVKKLREAGFSRVDGYEIGANITPDHILAPPLAYYHIVYLSNVLNVQPDADHIKATLLFAAAHLVDGGVCLFNYPKTPRYSNTVIWDIGQFVEKLALGHMERVTKNGVYGFKWTMP